MFNKIKASLAFTILLAQSAFCAEVSREDYLTGRFIPSQDSRFVRIEGRFAAENNMFLRKEAYQAFVEMAEKAKRESIRLFIVSGTRNFNIQKDIWESKWNGTIPVKGKNLKKSIPDPTRRTLEILKYSSMPGTSRHHWGADIDINSVEESYFITPEGKKVYEWLLKNAPKSGFFQPYTAKSQDRPGGYAEEKWHWSYLPLSKEFLHEYEEMIRVDKIKGFAGCETASAVKIIDNYVFGVNPKCKSEPPSANKFNVYLASLGNAGKNLLVKLATFWRRGVHT